MSSTSRSFENLSLDDKRAILAELLREKAFRSRSAPMSYAQERLWFLDQLEPGSAFYNVPGSYRLRGEINIGALERSLNEIVRRHEALRTRFQVVAGQPMQVIDGPREQGLEVLELGRLGAAGAEAEAMRLANEEGQRPFDLAQGPLLRSLLLRLGAGDYVLLVTMHHIVSDGWSAGVFMRELSVLYEAYSQGRNSPLGELPIQYADYAVWQRQRLQGEFLGEQLGYWREQLQGLRPLLELPADGVRPAVQRYRGAYQSFQLRGPVVGGLRGLSEQAGVTQFMTLLAAFQLLLWRYTGEGDVVVGTPIAGRTRAETEGLIGFFVNTLVLRTQLSGELSFLELLQRVREVTLGAYAHQELPFEKLVEELQPERNLSYNPLFQVMLVLQTDPQGRSKAAQSSSRAEGVGESGGAGAAAGQLMTGTAKFDLTLSVQESGGVLLGAVEYNTDLFSGARVVRLIGHYEQLLKSIVSNPQQGIGSLEILSPGEREQLLEQWPGSGEQEVRGTVLELFAAQVGRDGQRAALVAAGEELSYEELERRANQWAHYLRVAGVGAETVVGICLPRSVEQVVVVLGVLKSGAAYLPLEPGHPGERLGLMLEETGARLVITNEKLAQSLPASVSPLVLETVQPEVSQQPVSDCAVALAPDNLAYVAHIHENNTTITITHGDLRSAVRNATDVIDAGPNDRVLDLTSVMRDSYLLSIFATLLRGARLLLPQFETDAVNFARLIHEHQPAILVAPVARFLQLRHADLSSVNTVVLYGDNVSPRLLALFPGKRFVHIRELPCATLFHLSCDYSKAGQQLQSQVPYDPPANVKFHVLDKQLQLVPIGVTGELFIEVASRRGFAGGADLTAAGLVPDPFSNRPGASLYATGYHVRLDENGKLQYLGTSQEFVDLAGHNLRLKDVEAVIAQQSGVLYTTFRIDAGEDGPKSLIAYVLPDDTARSVPSISDLRDVPEYLQPSEYVLLSELPLAVDGEIDRQALPQDELLKRVTDEYVAPRNAIESILAGIWMDVLELNKISVHDNFFRLGGHSLLATMANFRVSDTLGIEVPVTVLFEAPTIADFASRLSNDPHDGKRIEQVARLLVSMDELSEDAVKALLTKAQTSGELK